MATILEFRAEAGRAAPRGLEGSMPQTAKIVIFPGIRVSYWNEASPMAGETAPAPEKTAGKKGKAQKKRRD